MKKIVCWLLVFGMVVFAFMVYDYKTNNRSATARLHTVTTHDYQEKMSFTAPILKKGNLYLMSGATRTIENISEGAVATVLCGNQTYEGYLWSLKPTFDGIDYATISVTGIKKLPAADATAIIAGNIRRDLIFVPKECLVTDEAGKDAVFVVQDGYAMLRRVKLGTLLKDGDVQIEKGVFPSEQLIISPKNIRTGDRILSP